MADHEIDEEEAVLPEEEEFDEEFEDEGGNESEDEGPELADGGVFRRVLAEFLGAFFLALVIASASGPSAPVLVGLTDAVMFFLFGPVSGGHFNPVVTAAVGLLGRIRGELAWLYLIVQFAAGFAAFALVWALRPPLDDAARAALRGSVDALAGARAGQVPWFPAAWPLLILLPALLVAVVLAARAKFGQEPAAAGWIGVAVGATFWLEGAIYPAASLPAVVFNGYASAFRALPVLLFFPLIGAYVGALLYRELVIPRSAVEEADEEIEDEEVGDDEEPPEEPESEPDHVEHEAEGEPGAESEPGHVEHGAEGETGDGEAEDSHDGAEDSQPHQSA